MWAFGRLQILKTWNGARKAIAFLEPIIKDMLVLECDAFFDQAADVLVDSFQSADDKTFFKCVNDCLSIANAKSKDPKCMRIIDKSTGKPTQNVVQEKHAFRKHFSDLMGGEIGTFAALIQKDRNLPESRFSGIDTNCLDNVVPTLFDLFNCFAKFVRGKATGESRLASDVFRRLPLLMARVYYPLVLKSYLRIAPPLQWKGGMICDLFKNKGSPSLISSYRDILLADDDGKGAQRLLRKTLVPLAHKLCVSTQFGGGLNGGETAIAHLYLRLIVDFIINNKTSGAIIFADVTSAFATLLRRIVFDIDQGDEQWLRKLSSSGFTNEDIDSIFNFIKGQAVSESCDPVDNFVFKFTEQWFTNTWNSHEYIPNITCTTAGSAAGTPLADLLYSIAMSRVLVTLRKALKAEGLDFYLNIGGQQFSLEDVSFVDDMALPIVSTAENLIEHVSQVCALIHLTFQVFGMVLNYAPGKSAAVLHVCGKGKRKTLCALKDAKTR